MCRLFAVEFFSHYFLSLLVLNKLCLKVIYYLIGFLLLLRDLIEKLAGIDGAAADA